MVSTALLVAAALIFGVGAAHSWLGERLLIGPLLALDRREALLKKGGFGARVLRFAWHLTTVAWWGIGAMLVAIARLPLDPASRVILVVIAATFLVTGLTILLTSRGRHLAWPVFVAIAGLSLAPLL